MHEPLDTSARIVTPERIVLEFPIAGPARRLCAYLLDQLAMLGFMLTAAFAIVIMTGSAGLGAGTGLLLAGYFAIVWGYGIVCEGFLNGQTLGKRALGLRVLSEQGAPITVAQAVLRNVIGTVDGPASFLGLLGLSSMTVSRRFQRLGDLAAGTMVVVEGRGDGRIFRPQFDRALERMIERLPERIEGSSRLGQVLADYAAERDRFLPPRRREMAAPLAEKLIARYHLPPDSDPDAVLRAVYLRSSGFKPERSNRARTPSGAA